MAQVLRGKRIHLPNGRRYNKPGRSIGILRPTHGRSERPWHAQLQGFSDRRLAAAVTSSAQVRLLGFPFLNQCVSFILYECFYQIVYSRPFGISLYFPVSVCPLALSISFSHVHISISIDFERVKVTPFNHVTRCTCIQPPSTQCDIDFSSAGSWRTSNSTRSPKPMSYSSAPRTELVTSSLIPYSETQQTCFTLVIPFVPLRRASRV